MSPPKTSSGGSHRQDYLRPFLVLNNVIAMSLSYAILTPAFIVLGSILNISMFFNIYAWFWTNLRRASATENGKVFCPSVILLAIECLGVVAFVVLYVITTMDTAENSWRDSVMIKTYASIGSLVAL